ncbi:MAG TPA: hypothetical protein DHN33_07875 [Eubacteriaceae bacterium]|nr:hypothetical protein [Eubacteriaceae bacterium]
MNDGFYERMEIDQSAAELVRKSEKKVAGFLEKQEETAQYNQWKIVDAMQKYGLGQRHFSVSTGYGYGDEGREITEKIYAEVFGGEDAIVRPHITSGTHAISLCLYGVLRSGDELLSVTGAPYDTIHSLLAPSEEDLGTLGDLGITYRQLDLTDQGMDYPGLEEALKNKPKMVYLQRSTGYAWRKALTMDEIEKAIVRIKEIHPQAVVMVDNCYGEFIEKMEPTEVGADLMAGSLIKNPGGGIAPTGGYVVGKKKWVARAAARLSAPGIGKETGATMGISRQYLQGLFLAPHVVLQALKTAIVAAEAFSSLGFQVCPKPEDDRSDIIQAIQLDEEEKLLRFCRAVQSASPVDSYVTPYPWDMPGYEEQVVMAAGAFMEGSSIELSADGPMKAPYIVYLQGGLTYEHGKMGIIKALSSLTRENA